MQVPQSLKQLGLTTLLLVLALVLESKAMVGAFKSVLDQTAALQYAALSGICALLAFVFSAICGSMKADIRKDVRKWAWQARLVSLACLLVPIGTLGAAMKHDRLVTEWPAYRASPAYAIDVAAAAAEVDLLDNTALEARERAQRRIQEPKFVTATPMDFEFWYAVFLQGLVVFGASIRLTAPATAEEVRHERAVQAYYKGLATRERNRKAREAKKKAANRKPLFGIIAGGKA